MKKLLIYTSILVFTLAACGPVYKTEYTYIPPETQEGRTCTFQCENLKLQCEQLEEMRYQRCLDRADRNYYDCERSKRYQYDSKGNRKCVQNCFCYRESCSTNTEHCEIKYRSCFGSCGGTVESQTYCVSNCEKANPGVPVRQ